VKVQIDIESRAETQRWNLWRMHAVAKNNLLQYMYEFDKKVYLLGLKALAKQPKKRKC